MGYTLQLDANKTKRMFNVKIIISPSKEMTKHAKKAERQPQLIEYAMEYSSGNEWTEDTTLYQALDLYNGLQFRYLKEDLSEEDFVFLDKHLRILSALYGVVKPFDGIRRYRKDFKTKGLYKLWGDKLYQTVTQEDRLILNLASDEFSKTITRYATDQDTIINVDFMEKTQDGKLKKHASISKKGRGQLVNYIAKHRITNLESVKHFDDMGYAFSEEQSDELNWVFIRPKD